ALEPAAPQPGRCPAVLLVRHAAFFLTFSLRRAAALTPAISRFSGASRSAGPAPALSRDLARQAPQLDEALCVALVEGVASVVRRQIVVVERDGAAPAGDDGPAAVQSEADVAGHVLLRVRDEGVERVHER